MDAVRITTSPFQLLLEQDVTTDARKGGSAEPTRGDPDALTHAPPARGRQHSARGGLKYERLVGEEGLEPDPS